MAQGAAIPPTALPGRFVPRNNDGNVYDYTVASFTKDATWRDLDLSAIVPANATAVLLTFYLNNNTAGEAVLFRKNGNTNTNERLEGSIVVVNLNHWFQGVIPCDTGRVIEYYATNAGTWAAIGVIVMGWFV